MDKQAFLEGYMHKEAFLGDVLDWGTGAIKKGIGSVAGWAMNTDIGQSAMKKFMHDPDNKQFVMDQMVKPQFVTKFLSNPKNVDAAASAAGGWAKRKLGKAGEWLKANPGKAALYTGTPIMLMLMYKLMTDNTRRQYGQRYGR